ncbi:MAG: hypothetical protein EBR82_56355 [Caulobacteraceae bacterium]|nr:hypothetical protein [Caulobacteraceae bacterium]
MNMIGIIGNTEKVRSPLADQTQCAILGPQLEITITHMNMIGIIGNTKKVRSALADQIPCPMVDPESQYQLATKPPILRTAQAQDFQDRARTQSQFTQFRLERYLIRKMKQCVRPCTMI